MQNNHSTVVAALVTSLPTQADLEAAHARCVDLYYLGHTKLGLDAATEGVAIARRSGDPAWLRRMLTAYAIFQSDLHNLPSAFDALSEALDLCELQDDAVQSVSVWNNIAAALCYAELPKQAIFAAQRALEYASRAPRTPQMFACEGIALSNISYAALFTFEYSLGLRCARASAEKFDEARKAGASETSELAAHQSLLFAIQGRLLQRVGLTLEAKRSLSTAAKFVATIPAFSRTNQAVRLAWALHDVYSGDVETGVSLLLQLASSEQSSTPELRADALRDLIEAFSFAKRWKEASEHMRQLASHMQVVRSDDIHFHHKRHLEQLRLQTASEFIAETRSRAMSHSHLSQGSDGYPFADRISVLEDLCVAAELHDDPSGKHPYRVAALSKFLARILGLNEEEANRLAKAAMLHDVGKVAIPVTILRKSGSLMEEESRIMKTHSSVGADLLASLEIDDQAQAVAVARHHHEWWSGSGYPDGLVGDEIPLAARIVSLAESFDAMTHDRPYRPRLSVPRTLEIIEERSGRQFDPRLSRLFVGLVHDLSSKHRDLDDFLECGVPHSSFLNSKERLIDRFTRKSPT